MTIVAKAPEQLIVEFDHLTGVYIPATDTNTTSTSHSAVVTPEESMVDTLVATTDHPLNTAFFDDDSSVASDDIIHDDAGNILGFSDDDSIDGDTTGLGTDSILGEEDIVHTVHQAAFEGDLETFKSLHESGANIYEFDDAGAMPLDYASDMGHRSIERYIASDMLLIGSREGEKDIVEYALDFFETNEDLALIRDDEGETALHLAVMADNADIVQLLCSRGMKADVQDAAGKEPSDYIIDEGFNSCAWALTMSTIGDDSHLDIADGDVAA